MNNLTSLVALLVGVVAFFVNEKLATTLIAIYLVIVGFIGLFGEGEKTTLSRPRTEAKPRPTAESEKE